MKFPGSANGSESKRVFCILPHSTALYDHDLMAGMRDGNGYCMSRMIKVSRVSIPTWFFFFTQQ